MAKKDERKAESLYKPLLIFYDCEAASGDLFNGDIIEIAARSSPTVIDASFESLIKTKKKLCWFGKYLLSYLLEYLQEKMYIMQQCIMQENNKLYYSMQISTCADTRRLPPPPPVLAYFHDCV